MTEQDDYLLLSSSDIFGKDLTLSNFLQDNQQLSPVIETNFPSPASSTDSLDSPEMTTTTTNTGNLSIDSTVLQNLPISVLQSLAAMYQQQDNMNGLENNFEQFVKFEEDNSISPSTNDVAAVSVALTPSTSAAVPNKPKAYRPPRQLECHNCHVTKTPLWRRTPDRAHSLCNACGLYYKQYGTHRPLHVRQKQQSSKQSSPITTPASTSPITSPITNLSPASNVSAAAAAAEVAANLLRPLLSQPQQQQQQQQQQRQQQCTSCHQSNTPLYRNSENGQVLCNACGIYTKMNQQQQQQRISHPSSPVEQQQQSPLKRRRESGEQQQQQQQQDGLVVLEEERASKKMTTTETPALFPATPVMPPSPPSVAVQSKEWAEIDDTRFKTLLSRMNAQQMHGFLGMLERRCAILRSILVPAQQE